MPSCHIKIRVIPNARATGWAGVMDDGETHKVRLHAPPVEGKANEELIRWLARECGVRPSALTLVRGDKSRHKLIRIEGLESLPSLPGPRE